MKKLLLMSILLLSLLAVGVSAGTYDSEVSSIEKTYRAEYQPLLETLGFNENCIKINGEKYTIFSSKNGVYRGCSWFPDSTVSISPTVLDMNTPEELNNAYHEGLIQPSLKTKTKVMLVCGIQRKCGSILP